jgi:hypothetical protein
MKTETYQHKIFKVSRRNFLKTTSMSMGGLLLGVQFSCTDTSKQLTGNPASVFSPNLFISINGLGDVTLIEEIGLIPPKDTMPIEEAHSLYDAERNYLGYATSLMYSSLLKRHIAIGKLPPQLSKPGSEAYLELMVVHRPKYVLANVVRMPFYDPPHKKQ